ncbi:GTP-binding protein [Diaporthe helianthi]|uniref:GTP-binding protein n=1 Tax=Diaporthe helianthi TaxID=158607 RepID=A0A2P5HQ77_DIAHE|nr:GTP-binding protein [Diaporthe helianthi]
MAGSINKPKKPKSKRGTTRLRAKIEKKSHAKQRKERKQAKKNPEWRSKLKKDPGIPNLFPYKERLLQEIEEKKARKAEEARKRKEAVKAAKTGQVGPADDGEQVMEEDIEGDDVDVDDDMMEEDDVDESNPMAALLASARRAAEDYERELQSGDDDMEDDSDDDSDDSEDDSRGVSRGAGDLTYRKAYDKVFKQVVEQADVILYVLDARDPEGTRSRDVEKAVMMAASGGKRLILVLNKIDLIPLPILKAWLAHLRSSFPTLPIRASKAAPNAHTFEHRDLTVQSTSTTLFRALKAFAASRNLKRAISVGVIGYPNVGKSSVINALLSRLSGARGQRTACPAGAEAGVTTSIRSVKIDSKLTLLDSPGIVFPSTPEVSGEGGFMPKNPTEAHAHLVLLNVIPPKAIEDPVPAVTLLLKRLSTSPTLLERLMGAYDLPPLLSNSDTGDSTMDFLVQVARKRGRLGRGGVPNIQAAAMTVVTDWRDGRIQGWVDAPAVAAAAPSADGTTAVAGIKLPASAPPADTAADQKQIVTEWAAEFKLDGLWGDDDASAVKEVEMGG